VARIKKTGGYKPGSVRFHVTAISLWLPLPITYSDLPEMPQNCGARAAQTFLFGLASSGACTATFVTKSAVSFYLAFSPLPTRSRRFVFCCAIHTVAGSGR